MISAICFFLTLLMTLVYLFLYHGFKDRLCQAGFLCRSARILSLAGLAVAILITAFALIRPELFISLKHPASYGYISPGNFARGRESALSRQIIKALLRRLSREKGSVSFHAVMMGLQEIIINAIEHGNLDISFDIDATMGKADDTVEQELLSHGRGIRMTNASLRQAAVLQQRKSGASG